MQFHLDIKANRKKAKFQRLLRPTVSERGLEGRIFIWVLRPTKTDRGNKADSKKVGISLPISLGLQEEVHK
jgi:hypothetical protein